MLRPRGPDFIFEPRFELPTRYRRGIAAAQPRSRLSSARFVRAMPRWVATRGAALSATGLSTPGRRRSSCGQVMPKAKRRLSHVFGSKASSPLPTHSGRSRCRRTVGGAGARSSRCELGASRAKQGRIARDPRIGILMRGAAEISGGVRAQFSEAQKRWILPQASSSTGVAVA